MWSLLNSSSFQLNGDLNSPNLAVDFHQCCQLKVLQSFFAAVGVLKDLSTFKRQLTGTVPIIKIVYHL